MSKFAVETIPVILETYPEVPRPLTVEANCVSRKVVETRFAKLAVETRLTRLAVETRFARLAVETTPVILETYPEVPRPLTVEANCVSRNVVETRLAKLAVETTPVILET